MKAKSLLHDPWVCTIITMRFRSSVPPSVHGQLVKMLITLEPRGIFLITFCIHMDVNIP